MYFKKSPSSIITRPSYYHRKLLRSPELPEVDVNRNLLVFPSSKQILPISSHPRNLKSSSRISDPLAPYSLSDKIIAEHLLKHNLGEKSYIVHLGYIKDGGILVIDPPKMESVNKDYEPYINFSGLNAQLYERVMEKRKFKKNWYLKQGYKEEEIEKIKIVEDMEPEKKAAKENRKLIRENLYKFLEDFFKKQEKNLKIFVFDSRNSFEYKAICSSLKKLNALDCLIHKKFQPGENYSSLEGLRREIKHLLYQNEIKENLRLEKYFSDVDFDFNWPPEFDPKSNSYTIFTREFLEKERNTVFGKIINDRLRYEQFTLNYKQLLQNFGFDEKEIEKKVESLPCFEPIENLILKQCERIGELKPFTKEIKRFTMEAGMLNSFSPSQLSAPCTLTRIYQGLNVRIRETREEERIFLGNEYHKLVLSDPEEAYLNHEIWKVIGLKPLPRSLYTEKQLAGEVELDGKKLYFSGIADAISICEDEIVLFEFKFSQVLPETYKRGHAKQLLAYKKILEFLGYEVADIAILLYGIAPPSKPELKSSVTNRYVIFSSELEEEFNDDLRDYFRWLELIYNHPEDGVKKLREEEVRRGCRICSSDSLADEKDKEAIKAIKQIQCK